LKDAAGSAIRIREVEEHGIRARLQPSRKNQLNPGL